MNESDVDALVRQSYERNSPTVDVDAAWETLSTRMAHADRQEESSRGRPALKSVSPADDRRQSSTRRVVERRASTSRRRSGWRVAVYASVAMVLVAAVAVGSMEAVKYLGREQRILVIGEDPVGMSPGSSGPSTATTVVNVQTTVITTPSATVSPPTTDSPYALETRLANGHFRGLVHIVYMDSLGEYHSIRVDYLEMLTGAEAEAAAVEDGVISPGQDLPNGYYIRNQTKPEEEGTDGFLGVAFAVYETAVITTHTFGDGGEQAITWEQFVSFWNPVSPPEGGENMRNAPWWIERDEKGNVVSITECVLP